MLTLAAHSQTVARKDLPLFVGSFARTDPQRPDSLRLSEFAEWFIDSIDTNGRRDSLNAYDSMYSRDRLWLKLFPDGQSPQVCENSRLGTPHGDCLFYIMSDMHGFEKMRDMLTVWRLKPRTDSVEFVGARSGFGIGIGRSWVERITVFPDGSLLLYAKSQGGDEEAWGSDWFLRADSLTNFVSVWKSYWNSSDLERTYVIADRLCSPEYDVIEVREYLHKEPAVNVLGEPILKADSARSRSIDLWQLTKEQFHIDAAQTPLWGD